MTGVPWRPPHRLAGPALRRPVVEGGGGRPNAWGEAAERMGGGGEETAPGQGHGQPGAVAGRAFVRRPHRPGGKRRRAIEDDRSCQDGVYGSCCSSLGLNYYLR